MGNSSSGVDNDPDVSEGEFSDDGGADNSATFASVRAKDTDTADFSDILDGHRLDLSFLFSQERLKAAALRVKEELPVNILQTHHAQIVTWLEDRAARNEESVTASQFCDMLADRGVGRVDAMRAFEKFDCDGSGTVEVQSMQVTLNMASMSGGTGVLSNEGEMAYCSKSIQGCPLMPGFVDVFTSAESSSKQATKIFNFFYRNRAAASAFVYPLLDSFHDTANMRESVVKNYFEAVHLDDGSDGMESTMTSGEGVKLVLKPYSAIEVSTNTGAADKLTDGDATTFWQSDGSARSHWIRIRMKPNIVIKQLFMYVSATDQSYMPSDLTVAVGKSTQSLHTVRDIRIPSYVTGPVLLLENMKSYFPFVQVFIKRCQNDGCDTRVRLLKVIGCRLTKELQVSVSDATALWYVQLVASTAVACLPAAPGLHDVILQHTRQALEDIPPLSLTSGSSERPAFATESVLNEVGRFMEQINGAGDLVSPAATSAFRLASGLHVQLAFSLARGSLSRILRAISCLLGNPDIKLKAYGLLKSLENAKVRFLRRRARQLTLTLMSCDGDGGSSSSSSSSSLGRDVAVDAAEQLAAGAQAGADAGADASGEEDEEVAGEKVVPPSHILTVTDWAAPSRPYVTQTGKKNLNMIFKAADYMQLTKVKVKVDKGGRGARCGLIFLLDDSVEGFDQDDILMRYEKYDSWTEADFQAWRESQVRDSPSGPAAFFSIPDDWDEADVHLTCYVTCQLVLLKLLRPRSEASDRIGIIGIKFYGYNRNKDFKTETEEGVLKTNDLTKESELAPEDISSCVLSFLLAVLNSQDFSNSKKASQPAAGIDITGVSVKCLWDLYNAVPSRNNEWSSIRTKCLHLMHIVFAHSPSDFAEEEATAQMFSSFCCLVDSPGDTSKDVVSIVTKIILDGAKVFFPNEKTRLDQLLNMMNSANDASMVTSASLIFESLCRFYSTVDPSGLLNLPKLSAPKAYIDMHFIDIMDVMLNATLRDFKLYAIGKLHKPSSALFRLLCCLQTTFVCWVKAALRRGPDSGAAESSWIMVAESALTKYIQLLCQYNTEAFAYLLSLESSQLVPVLRNDDKSNFFQVICQMVTIMLSMSSMLGPQALDKMLESLMPVARFLDKLSLLVPDIFLKPESEQWSKANAGKAVVLRVWEEESAHSYHNNQHITRLYSSPGASLLVVEFDSRCETERRYDYLEFTDATGTKTRYEHKVGTDKWPLRVEFRGSKLYFLFHSDPSNNEWGYKFKVTAYGSPEVSFCWPFDLQLCLAKLIGRACSRLLACSSTVTPRLTEQLESESAEAALLKSELWRTLFRAGYTPMSVEHTVSGYHATLPDDGKNFLLALLDTPEEPCIVEFIQRCQERSRTRLAYGGEIADHAVLAVLSALLWHTPQLREDIEKYVSSGFAALHLTDGVVLAYTVAEGLRPQLVAARQKQQEKSCQQQQQNILKEIAVKASFLLKFACLTRMQLRTEASRLSLKSAKLRRHVGHLSADVEVIWKLDSASFERFPTFRFILEFILESSWTMENVTKVIQERRVKAEAVAHAYSHAHNHLMLSSDSGIRNIFEIQNVVLLVELLSAQKDMPRHYLDFLDGCGLQLESNVRKNFYNFVKCVVQSLASTKRSQLRGNTLATYDTIMACVLHLLAVDWRPYDLAFVEELQIPLFLLNTTRDTVAVLKAVRHEISEAEELSEHKQALLWLNEERGQLDALLDASRSSSGTEPSKAMKMFIAKYSDVIDVETVCDGCRISLPARRYRCLQCLDTDLCSDCFSGAVQPLRCHKEDHDFVHFMFKCNHCRGFISGARMHCDECDDFDLCFGCYKNYLDGSSTLSTTDHLPDHKLTRHPQMRYKLSGNSSNSLVAYIHQCTWLEYIQLTLSMAGMVCCKDALPSTIVRDDNVTYYDTAIRLLMCCIELVACCLKQATVAPKMDDHDAGSGDNVSEKDITGGDSLEHDKKLAFTKQFQERVMGLLGVVVTLESQTSIGHVMSSFFNAADFLKLLLLIASGYSSGSEPDAQHLALGLVGQLLTKPSADLKAADDAVEEVKHLLPDPKRQLANATDIATCGECDPAGAKTVKFFIHLATLCLDRQLSLEWCATIVHVIRQLLSHEAWRPLVTTFVRSSIRRALNHVDSHIIIANLTMAGFPQILFPGMRVKQLDSATEDKNGVVLRHFPDKMHSLIIDIKTRKRHLTPYGNIQPLEATAFPFDESLLTDVSDYIEQAVGLLRQGQLTLSQLWALCLCLKAFNQAVITGPSAASDGCAGSSGCCAVPNELQQRLMPQLVHVASLTTSFTSPWVTADIEVLAAILYARAELGKETREGGTSIGKIITAKLVLPEAAQADSVELEETSFASAEGLRPPGTSTAAADLQPTSVASAATAGTRALPPVPSSTPRASKTSWSAAAASTRSATELSATEEPFEESGYSGLTTGLPTADSGGRGARRRRMESAKLLRAELSASANSTLKTESNQSSPAAVPEAGALGTLPSSSTDLSVDRAAQVCAAVCILYARQTLLSVLSKWPDDCHIPLRSALLLDGQDMNTFLSVLDLLNSSNDVVMFRQVVAKLMSCCEQDYLPAVAVTAASFMEEEGGITRAFESSHEKPVTAVPKTKVSLPGATHMTLKFDARCGTDENANKLIICINEDFTSDKVYTLSGCSASCWQDIELPGDTFYYKYHVENEDSTLWGWRFTVSSQRGRFETGHTVLRYLLENKELARLLPMTELWTRLVAVACRHTGEQRLKTLQLLLLLVNFQAAIARGESKTPPAAVQLELQLLRPLWALYNAVLDKSGTDSACLPQLARALTELFLCVENLVLACGRDREYAAWLLGKSQIIALVKEGLVNVRAVSAAIGYPNKTTADLEDVLLMSREQQQSTQKASV